MYFEIATKHVHACKETQFKIDNSIQSNSNTVRYIYGMPTLHT